MPREIVHWHVVDMLVEALRGPCSPLADALCAHRPAAYLGAIIHDAPYYYALATSAESQQVAERLHGRDGEDTYRPLFNVAQHIQSSQKPEDRQTLLAFLCGMVSHAIVDMRFHPLIIYITGDYYHLDPNQRRLNRAAHRLFEVQLDSYARQTWQPRCPTYLNSILEGSLCACVSELLAKSIEGDINFWSKCIRDTAWCQKRFLQARYGAAMRVMAHVWPSRFREFDALFSFWRHHAPPNFSKPISYKNPVTGTDHTHTFEELLHDSIMDSVHVLGDIFKQRYTFRGASLSYGVMGAKNEDAVYFES